MYLSLEEDLRGVGGGDQAGPQGPVSEQDALLTALTQWWSTHALQPYLALPPDRHLEPIMLSRVFLGQQVTYIVRLDENLLGDLFEIYATYGWDAVEQIERFLTSIPVAYRSTLRLMQTARTVLDIMTAQALVEAESLAITYARARWKASRATLDQWLSAFSVLTLNVPHPKLTDRDLADKLLAACRRYASLRTKVLALQRDIDARNRVVPPSRRIPGSGAALWFELYAAPQRKLLAAMTDELATIASLFQPAALILDDLPAEMFDDTSAVRRVTAAIAFETKLYDILVSLATGTDNLLATLGSAAATSQLQAMLKPLISGDLSNLDGWTSGVGGAERAVLNEVLRRDADDQRVLANPEMILNLFDDEVMTERGSWNQVVLFRYCRVLVAEVDDRKDTDARWAAFWEWVGRITAGLALISLMAVFPFAEAAAPALVSALTLAGTAAAIGGVVTLVLHHLVGALLEAGKLDQQAADRLFRLGQDDPQAISEIGESLARSASLRRAVTQGALLTLITMGAAHKIKSFAVALDFQSFVDDVGTLFASSDATDSADDTAVDSTHR